MAGPLPLGDPAPADGALPSGAAAGWAQRDFGVYIHVPFCAVRCGYCDFNTYTATELRGERREDYAGNVVSEMAIAARVLNDAGIGARSAATVFFGGGTPTLLPAADLALLLGRVREHWGLSSGAEVTVEANPDTVTAEAVDVLAAAGVTRLSIGMQSAVPHVLRTLDRSHTPAGVAEAVGLAKRAGLQVSLDLIYGTPGESLADWGASIDAALSQQPDHLSAYALIVEPGTKLARQIDRGEVAQPDDDLTADMYELADERLHQAGYQWYELSNWSTGPDTRSRHNLSYWTSQDWWGFGPGAHSHVGGLRWWNVKHPAAYAERLRAGQSPAAGRETPTDEQARLERILLTSRLSAGVDLAEVAHPESVAQLIADELIDPRAALAGRGVLTVRGRLLADVVARTLTEH